MPMRGGKHVRIVHCGRSWANIERFDLIVTTPQYRSPKRPNVLQYLTPLRRVTDERLRAAAADWVLRLSGLPGPYLAVVIGGNSGPFTFDHAAAKRLARQACATRKPVHIFDLGVGRTAMRQLEQEPAQIISAVTEGRVFERAHVQAFIYRMTMHVGPQRMTRDIRIVHKVLVDNDMAVWLGDPFPQGDSRGVESVKRAVDRVRRLFGLTEAPDVDAKPAIRTTRGELLRTAS